MYETSANVMAAGCVRSSFTPEMDIPRSVGILERPAMGLGRVARPRPGPGGVAGDSGFLHRFLGAHPVVHCRAGGEHPG